MRPAGLGPAIIALTQRTQRYAKVAKEDNRVESGVNNGHSLLREVKTTSAALALGISIGACAGLPGFGGTNWKEEVLLHDGSKIIVKRSQSYGGQHEFGQAPPIKEQDISFTLPRSSETITWKSEYGEDIRRSNFNLVALHVLQGVPYIVAVPYLCLSYNKWGRPNPPYVFFKYDGKLWQRIPLSELPVEFKGINLVVNSEGEQKIITAQSVVSAQLIKKLNGELRQPEYRSILREKVKPGAVGSSVNCEEMIRYKCGWGAPGEFNKKYFERICK
jgi:hypothetical protein